MNGAEGGKVLNACIATTSKLLRLFVFIASPSLLLKIVMMYFGNLLFFIKFSCKCSFGKSRDRSVLPSTI